jgi:hypothetical protein
MRIQTTLIAIAGFGVASAANAEGPDFEKEIWPFVKNSCVSCHTPEHKDERGRTRRPKGDLVITNKEAFMKGGEGGAVIVAGKPEESPFLSRTKLPLDHDDHMPPEGKADQWTDEQKALFEAWVKAGANFGTWVRDAEADKKDA